MSKGAVHKFYSSKRWIHCRTAYLSSVGGLCELCLRSGLYRPAEVVHHIRPITDENLNDPEITLSWSNLMALCKQHHAEAHDLKQYLPKNGPKQRYVILPDGSVKIIE